MTPLCGERLSVALVVGVAKAFGALTPLPADCVQFPRVHHHPDWFRAFSLAEAYAICYLGIGTRG
jgi:hypothetical protein